MPQSKNKEQAKLDAEVLHDLRMIRKELKKLSKNQIINVALDQMNRYMEQKQANEILLEKLGVTNEDT
jgi:hypothetical protein